MLHFNFMVKTGLISGRKSDKTHLCSDRYSRVDRVGDDAEHGIRTSLGASLCERHSDSGVDVEQIVTCHAGFSGYTSGHYNDLTA